MTSYDVVHLCTAERIYLPGVVALGIRQPDLVIVGTVILEGVFVEAGVLDVIGSHLLFALDLDTNVQSDRPAHCRLVRPFLCKSNK